MAQHIRINAAWLFGVLLITSLLYVVAPSTATATYVTPSMVDVTKVIAPPPAPDSADQQHDLDAVLEAQAARTKNEINRVNETEQLSVFGFSDVLGESFNEEALPITATLFQQLFDNTLVLLKVAKDRWNRPRPFLASHDVQPYGELPKSGAYPSGNSWIGHLFSIVLADLIPEKRTMIFTRGKETGDNRVIAGVHYPSDIHAGRQAAAAMAAILYTVPDFLDDLNDARLELRSAGFIDSQDSQNR